MEEFERKEHDSIPIKVKKMAAIIKKVIKSVKWVNIQYRPGLH